MWIFQFEQINQYLDINMHIAGFSPGNGGADVMIRSFI